MSENTEQPMETKTVNIAGFTADQRKQDLEKRSNKLAKDGWQLKEYNDNGMSGSKAIFFRPMTATNNNEKELGPLGKAVKAIIAVVVLVIAFNFYFGGDDPALDPDMKLSRYQSTTPEKRAQIIAEFVQDQKIPTQSTQELYDFMSEMSWTKSGDLKVTEVLGWASAEMAKNNGHLATPRINMDALAKNFSPWDGCYRPLEKMIKMSMHDEKSYDHLRTSYRLVLHGAEPPYAVIATTYSGKNAFGGTVKEVAKAKVDIATGNVVQILQ